jgi:hypothetical protein
VSDTGVSRLVISGNVLSVCIENKTKHVETFERHIQLQNIQSICKHIKISVIACLWEMLSERNHERQVAITRYKLIGKFSVPWS